MQTIARIKNGDDSAFGEIYDQYRRLAASVLMKIGRCPRDELDDHLNEVFFRLYKGIFRFKGDAAFSTYVYRSALRYSFRLCKRIRRERKIFTEPDENMGDSFEEKVIQSLVMEKILDALGNNHRAVIVLFYYDRLSLKEIAKIAGGSENAVKNRLYQAREKIRKHLENPEGK